ncbi:hypothetical protein K435DRAFT_857169 [Dendrothele bispora CBS 962.96]|uniref:Uncharacterized protein n=1 Tax=Dendrothele bispora (strain CBS 962.96) TaxID=1314807 RepID=A0A4S8M7A3_DENBC|nr:hypothetical protein K435DRAFT_857169 [Dendrothele bispora CBS 962.96]
MSGKLGEGMHASEFLDTFLGTDAFEDEPLPTSCWDDRVQELFQNVNVTKVEQNTFMREDRRLMEGVKGARLALHSRL